MLLAAAPLFAAPPDRAAAEFALTCLARVRFLSEESLLALAGPHGLRPDLVDDWVKAGVVYRGTVATDVLAGREVRYLALTTLGARLLQGATGEFVQGVSPAALRRESIKRPHDLAAGEVAATFLALADQGRVRLLGVELDSKRIGVTTVLIEPGKSPERVPLQADLLVAIQTATGPSAVLVEVDMGTVGVPRMARKYAAYLSWARERGPAAAFSISSLRVVTLTTTEARLRRLHDAALDATGRGSRFLLFGLLCHVNVSDSDRVFAPIVRQLGGEATHRVPLFSESGAALQSAA